MSISRYTVAFASLLICAASCVSPEEHRRVRSANEALKAEIASLTEHQRQLGDENARLRADVERLGKSAADADWVREQKEKLERLLKQYQEGAPSAIPGVELINTAEGFGFRVAGGVLFASGKTDITDQGKQILTQLITTLKQEGRRIRVDGHTDDQPIQHSAWGTNLRLSVERSLSVADFLIKNGLGADKVGVAGYGEYRPAVEGANDEARQKNRRVEILMLNGR
jgi:flagellar motor protein MotB